MLAKVDCEKATSFKVNSSQIAQMTNLELTELLYDAIRTPLGTVIQTEDPERLRQKLYSIRRESEDFMQLSFVISPINGLDLWVVNKGNANVEG